MLTNILLCPTGYEEIKEALEKYFHEKGGTCVEIIFTIDDIKLIFDHAIIVTNVPRRLLSLP